MSPIIELTPDLLTGVTLIDMQHREMVRMVNELHTAQQIGKGEERVKQALVFLLRYTESHFATEEHLLTSVQWPGLAEHRHQHAELVRQVNAFSAQKGIGEDVGDDVARFMAEWVRGHIRQHDLAYAPFLRERGIK